jgi:hypothetical protein
VTSASLASALAVVSPPKPAPRITTRGRVEEAIGAV